MEHDNGFWKWNSERVNLSERAKREQYRAANEKARLDRLHKQAKRQYNDAGDGDNGYSDADSGL